MYIYLQWFFNDIESKDEDEIKFQADYYFYKKEFSEALPLYLNLLECK